MKIKETLEKTLMDKEKLVHGTSILYLPSILESGLNAKRVDSHGSGDSWRYGKPRVECEVSNCVKTGWGNTYFIIDPDKVNIEGDRFISDNPVKETSIEGIVYDENCLEVDSRLNRDFLNNYLFEEINIGGEKFLFPNFNTKKSWMGVSEFFRLTYEKSGKDLFKEVSEEVESLGDYNHNRGDYGVAIMNERELSFVTAVKGGYSKKDFLKINPPEFQKRTYNFNKWNKAFIEAIETWGYNPNGTVGDFFDDMNKQSKIPFYLIKDKRLYFLEK